MMGWRDYAKQVQEGRDNRDDRDTTPAKAPIVPIVPNVPEAVAVHRLDDWCARLNGTDAFTSPPGWTLDQWLRTMDASTWLFENFAEQAVRWSWSALDLFGVLPNHPGLGGLSDRIGEVRNLKMAGGLSAWSSIGARHKLARGWGDYTDGMVAMWEANQAAGAARSIG